MLGTKYEAKVNHFKKPRLKIVKMENGCSVLFYGCIEINKCIETQKKNTVKEIVQSEEQKY